MDENLKHELQVASYRGIVIQAVIILERAIDIYLANYFCIDKKRNEIMELILIPRMSLDSKKQVLDYILKKQPALLQAYPTLLKDLDEIIEQRNRYAHYMHLSLDYHTKYDELPIFKGDFVLQKTKNDHKAFVISESEFDELEALIKKCTIFISDLLQ